MRNILRTGRAMLMVAAMCCAAVASSQSLRTAYFMDGSLFNYRINPATAPNRGHVSIPLLGGVGVNMMGNVGFENFFFNSPVGNDRSVMFFDETVDKDEFLNGLENDNQMRMDMDLTLLSFGFNGFGGFNTIDMTLRSNMALNLPYELLEFMKVADTFEGAYNIKDINLQTRNFIDLSFGHSHKIGENLTVGARAKLLFGLGYGNVEFSKMNMSIIRGEDLDDFPGMEDLPIGVSDRWKIEAHGEANVAFGGDFKISDKKTVNGKNGVIGYDDIEPGLNGFGLGMDLGAVYAFDDVLDGLTVSASISDLGFIRWNKNRAAVVNGEPYAFDGFRVMDAVTGKESINEQLESLTEDLEDFITLEDKGEKSYTSGIGAKLNLGAEYAMPFYDKLSAGVLYTHCFDDLYSYDMATAVISFSPNKVLDFAASSTFSNYGTSFGAVANVHFTGFSLYVGTDCFLRDMSDHWIPNENLNASISFGVNIALAHKEK